MSGRPARRAADVGAAADPARRDLERLRPAVGVAARSPRRRARPRAPAAPARPPTTSGTRAVMSSRLRVKTATSSPSRCTWMRTPSSFHSTAAGPTSRQRRGDARRGLGQHRLQRAADREAERARAPRAPPAQRGRGHRAEVAAQHQRPPHLGRRHAGGPGDGLDHHALQRALAQLARRAGRPGSAARRRSPAPNSSASSAPPRGLRAGPGRARRSARRRASTSATVSVGSAAGGGQVAQRGPADPDLALAQLAGEVRHAPAATSSGSTAPQARRRAARPWPGGPRWRRRRRRSRRPRRAAPGHCPRMPGAVDNLAHPGPVLG